MKVENKTSLKRFIITVLVAVLFIFEMTRIQHTKHEKESLEKEYATLKEEVSHWEDSVYSENEWLIAGLIDSANLDLAYGRCTEDEHLKRMHEIDEISDHIEKEPPYITTKRERMDEIEKMLKKF